MGIQDQLNVDKKLSNNELLYVVGGASISGTIVNAFVSVYKTLYGFGQNFGSSLRRIYKKKLCSF